MNRILATLFTLLSVTAMAQQRITLSGYVADAQTGEKLIGATIYDAKSQKGTITNNYGFYSLSLSGDTAQLTAMFVGYTSNTVVLALKADKTVDFNLGSNNMIEEVEVMADRVKESINSTQMSMVSIPIKAIQDLPVIMGETDVIKTLQLLPGVQQGTDGFSGFYVRGGGPDQNLILLDGVPVYNIDHVMGIFSVFNGDAVNSVNLYKGGFPARYGGRLSSVLDIRMKEGNNQKFGGKASIGLISSRVTLEGPILKDKASFIISARRTYWTEVFRTAARVFAPDQISDEKFGAFFYDLNAKVNYRLSGRDRLYLSTYNGRDKFYFKDKWDGNTQEIKLQWGNTTSALRWNHLVNPKMFMNSTLTYSKYEFLTGAWSQYEGEKSYNYYSSGITDWAARLEFDYAPNPAHAIKFGANHIRHTFNPGVEKYRYSLSDTTIAATLGNSAIKSIEHSLYFEDDMVIGPVLKANVGIHYSGFTVRGKYLNSLEPRVSLRYKPQSLWSIKASYARMGQYLHLLTQSSLSLPTDLWVPATDQVPMQHSWQAALGGAYELHPMVSLSVEAFYKEMDQVIEYQEGASYFNMNTNWETQVTTGKGRSYGAEVFLQKSEGNHIGWIGYTLSRASRQFPEKSDGKWYPYKYDRTHDISLAYTFKPNEWLSMGLVWVYGTGYALSLPTSQYQGIGIDGQPSSNYNAVQHFSSRNGFRMPAYHRMDVSISAKKEKPLFDRYWVLSVYNAYNRKNPFFIYVDDYTDTGRKKIKQVSIMMIMPSITWRIEF